MMRMCATLRVGRITGNRARFPAQIASIATRLPLDYRSYNRPGRNKSKRIRPRRRKSRTANYSVTLRRRNRVRDFGDSEQGFASYGSVCAQRGGTVCGHECAVREPNGHASAFAFGVYHPPTIRLCAGLLAEVIVTSRRSSRYAKKVAKIRKNADANEIHASLSEWHAKFHRSPRIRAHSETETESEKKEREKNSERVRTETRETIKRKTNA